MKLYDILESAMYFQQFSVYITNIYDQNLLIGRGTRAEMLDERSGENGDIFNHLMDNVSHWTIRNGRMIVFIEDEYRNARVETRFSNSDKWGKDPEHRPWRHSIETEEYTDEYINIVLA